MHSYPAFHANGTRTEPGDFRFGCIPAPTRHLDTPRRPQPPRSPLALAEETHSQAMRAMTAARRELGYANAMRNPAIAIGTGLDLGREHRSAAMRALNAARRALHAAADALDAARAETAAPFTFAQAA